MAGVHMWERVTVSVMPAGCRVSVRHILEVWTPCSPVHFHTRCGQFDCGECGHWTPRRVRCGTQYGLSVSRVQLSVTSSHLPSHTAAAIASTDDIHTEAMACPGGKEEGRQLVHVTNVACRAGRLKSRAREPAASMRTVTLRARAVKLAEGAPGERRPPERLPSVRSANAKRATPTMSRRSQAPPL